MKLDVFGAIHGNTKAKLFIITLILAVSVPAVSFAASPNVTIQSPGNQTYGINVSLSFTVLNSSGIDRCWYKLNNTANTSLSNCNNITFLGSGSWNNVTVYANDTLGILGSSNTTFFSIDATPPAISILSPTNQTYPGNNFLISLNITTSDANGIDKCWYRLNNDTANISVSCINGTFSAAYGWNNITVFANDTFGNKGNSSTIFFSIGPAPPSIIIQSPLNQTYGTNISLTFNVSQNTNPINKCWYILNNTANISLPNCNNITFIGSGGWNNITVFANDTVGTVGSSSTSFFGIDTTPPTVTIFSPSNQTYNNSIFLNFTTNYSAGNYPLKNSSGQTTAPRTVCDALHPVSVPGNGCSILTTFSTWPYGSNPNLPVKLIVMYNDTTGKSARDYVSLSNATSQPTTYTGLNLTVCNNDYICQYSSLGTVDVSEIGNAQNTGGYDFQSSSDLSTATNASMIEETQVMDFYANYTYVYNITTTSLIFNAYDANGVNSCWYRLNTTNISVPACSDAYEFNAFNASAGWNNITVFANDTFGNTGSSNTVFFSVLPAPPNVTIFNPVNQTYNSTNISLYFTTQSTQPLDKCWYVLNETTNTSLPSCSNTTFLVNSDGWYNLTVFANNSVGNIGNSSEKFFSVDTTPPVITNASQLGTLAAGTTSTTMSVTTNENATCAYSSTDQAYVNMTSTFNVTGTTSHNTTISGLSNGQSYTYYVRCIDSVGNADMSSTVISFTVAASSGGGSSVGGGGFTSTLPSSNNSTNSTPVVTTTPSFVVATNNITVKYDKIAVNSPVLVSFPSYNVTGISQISFTLSTTTSNVAVTVTKLNSRPMTITTDPAVNVYKYLEIDQANLSDTTTKSILIKFQVDKSWLAANSIDTSRVYLSRYSNGAWFRLTTTKFSEDTNKIYYTAQTPGFSYYAITGEVVGSPPAPGESIQQINNNSSNINNSGNPAIGVGKENPLNVTIAVIGAIIVLIILGYVYYVKHVKKSRHTRKRHTRK